MRMTPSNFRLAKRSEKAGVHFLDVTRFFLIVLIAHTYSSVGTADDGGAASVEEKKHVVFVTGDEEYRSEESMPMLAKILERDYPIRTTVLYAINKESGDIDPLTVDNLPGLQALKTADLAVFFIRYRALPQEQFQWILDYCQSGKPRAAFRTTNHAFRYRALEGDPRKKWDYGFGTEFFGQRFIGYQSGQTDVTLFERNRDHVVLRGVEPFHARSWLYTAEREEYPLAKTPEFLLVGHPVGGEYKKPPVSHPCAWLQRHKRSDGGEETRVFYTSLGHPLDFKRESMRRLSINALLWCLGMEGSIPANGANAATVGAYDPTPSKVGGHKRGVRPPSSK